MKDNHSKIKKLKQFKIDIDDNKENTINFALLENQLNLFNLILLLPNKKKWNIILPIDLLMKSEIT